MSTVAPEEREHTRIERWRGRARMIWVLDIKYPFSRRWGRTGRPWLMRQVPDRLVYWLFIREGAKFGTGPDCISLLDLLKQVESRHEKGWP